MSEPLKSPDDLPPWLRDMLKEPAPESPLPSGKKQVTKDQLAIDLDYEVGGRVGAGKLKVEDRNDPVEELTAPLVKYPDRRFFYSGLLYGYCLLDSAVTERYRAQKEVEARSWVHQLQHPVVEIPAFPDFVKTRVSHILQSMEVGRFQDFVGFVCSNNIVDRNRSRVWFVDAFDVKVPDPFMVDAHQPPHDVDITLFCPKTHKGSFAPVTLPGPFVEIPKIAFVQRYDKTLEEVTKGLLNDGSR